MFHYTIETPKSIDEAIQSLEKNLKEEKFGVQWQFNVQETLENKGFELENPFTILEVCNPKEAQSVLSANQLIGYFLPCKIVVYNDKHGKTKIGMPRPTVLIQMVEDESIQEVAADIEKRLIACIEKSR
ncbi:hypothetical protein ACA30_00145 [Virgibacillus soli]|uniref:DUF302 domain-containing protein n=1 Tax=Lederbergia galactosidilytica TaxID=217031 RepID=A0A0Q9Y372_9BACI|nr:hypothetical protein ACA29_16970 [Lederbergia galactosidilytica]KRG16588.1 hypothetical protein ACA30_00145 [Virgibacillus soli]MBP1917255.1 uncharacterized protein (DUF302 family) [Lederbergia galactosidilytica]